MRHYCLMIISYLKVKILHVMSIFMCSFWVNYIYTQTFDGIAGTQILQHLSWKSFQTGGLNLHILIQDYHLIDIWYTNTLDHDLPFKWKLLWYSKATIWALSNDLTSNICYRYTMGKLFEIKFRTKMPWYAFGKYC